MVFLKPFAHSLGKVNPRSHSLSQEGLDIERTHPKLIYYFVLFCSGGVQGSAPSQTNVSSPAAAPSPTMNPGSVNSMGSHPASGCSTPASYLGSAAASPAPQGHGPGTPGGMASGPLGQLPIGGADGMGSHGSSPATPASGTME